MPFITSIQYKEIVKAQEKLQLIQKEIENTQHLEQLDLQYFYPLTTNNTPVFNKFKNNQRNLQLSQDIESLLRNQPTFNLAGKTYHNVFLYAKQILSTEDYILFYKSLDENTHTDLLLWNKELHQFISVDLKVRDFEKDKSLSLSIYRDYWTQNSKKSIKKLTFNTKHLNLIKANILTAFKELANTQFSITHQVWQIYRFDLRILEEDNLIKLFNTSIEDCSSLHQQDHIQYVKRVPDNLFLESPNWLKQFKRNQT